MLSVLYGSVGTLTSSLTPVDALALLVFCLLYTPCVAAVAAVKRERGALFATGTVVFQCVVAWVVALLLHFMGLLFI